MIFPYLLIVVLFVGIVLLGREWFKSQDEIKELASDRYQLQRRRDSLNEDVDALQERIDDLHIRMNLIRDERDAEIADIAGERNDLRVVLEAVTKERDEAKAALAEATQERNRIAAEYITTENRCRGFETLSNQMANEASERDEELDSAKVEIEALRHELATAREFGDQLITIREKLRDALAAKRPNWKKLVEGLL